jgi:hypothetical protein
MFFFGPLGSTMMPSPPVTRHFARLQLSVCTQVVPLTLPLPPLPEVE